MSIENGFRNLVRWWLAAVALAAFSLSASAQITTLTRDRAGGYGVTGSGKTFTVGNIYSSPVPNTWELPPGTMTGHRVGNFGIGGGAAGPSAQTVGKVPIPGGGGRSVPVTATGAIAKPSAAGAIARFAGRLAFPVQAGMAVYDLLTELGYIVTNDDGLPGVEVSQQITEMVCEAPGCYWKVQAFQGPTPDVPCEAYWKDRLKSSYGSYSIDFYDPGRPYTAWCKGYNSTGGYVTSVSVDRVGTPVSQTITLPVSLQEVEDAIAAMSGWPDSATRALADSLNAGESVEVQAPIVTGPSSVQGQEEKTQTPVKKADGTPGTKTETKTTSYAITYNNNQLSITQNISSSSTTIYEDGTTETEEGPTQEKEAECAPEDPACEKNEFDVPDGEVPKATKNVEFEQEDMGWGGGSCPVGPQWSDVLGSHAISLQPYCDVVSSVVRPLVLAFAALMALAIAMPGVRLEG